MDDRLEPDDIVRMLAERAGLSIPHARAFLQAQADLAGELVGRGYPIAGIGLLYREDRPAKQLVGTIGPMKGRLVDVPAKTKVKVTLSPAIKDRAFGITSSMPDVFSLNWYWPKDEPDST